MPDIREIQNNTDLLKSFDVIVNSFKTVADDFKLTIENCPTNTAFLEYRQLIDMKEKGIKFYGLFIGEKLAGFVAVENAGKEKYYLEKLSVLPEYRHNGYGIKLMDFAFDYVKKEGGKIVSIGVMDNNIILKDWYKSYGFKEKGKKEFAHLPFTVCFMEKYIPTVNRDS